MGLKLSFCPLHVPLRCTQGALTLVGQSSIAYPDGHCRKPCRCPGPHAPSPPLTPAGCGQSLCKVLASLFSASLLQAFIQVSDGEEKLMSSSCRSGQELWITSSDPNPCEGQF